MVVKRSTKTSPLSDKATSSWRHSSHNSEQNCEGEFLHLIGSFFVITLPLKVLSEWSASPSMLFCVLLWNGQTTGTHIQCTVCWVGRVAVKGVTPVVGPTCPRNLWSFMCPTGNGHFWYFRQTLGIFGIMTKVWAFLVHMVKLWGIFGIIPLLNWKMELSKAWIVVQ